ncbi:MAG: aspartate carbamoyltransferase [Ruminococcaceae bacterium]|nr:aspartate carbamoyltransferase [Oscillospiraceae bacterium]
MKIEHLIDFSSITPEEWNILCNLADDIRHKPAKYADACRGKVMATLFYEPSTRTQLSFQTAMQRLGGTVIGFADPQNSSVSKGESLRDTIKIVSGYADIIVMRNPKEGAAYAASLYSRVPFINAGDGGHLHPTQTMADMYTLRSTKGRTDHLKIGMCGDLLNGRTVHSLTRALSARPGNHFYFISTPELSMPEYITDMLEEKQISYSKVSTLDECINELDVLYMTRIQKERFASEEEYRAQSGVYVLTKEKMDAAKSDLVVLHPLPKVDEIDYEVDDDPRAKYFLQAENGMYIRMALILSMCDIPRKSVTQTYPLPKKQVCSNPRCITRFEPYLPEIVDRVGDKQFCAYCEHKI